MHSIDDEGKVDYQSTLRVRRLNFKEYPVFQKGLAMLTRKLKIGNPTSSSVRNQHGDGFGQMYPLGTHMHNGKYAVYAKSVCVTKEVLSALMPCYRKVLSDHIPYDLHALDGHAEYHGMRPTELMGGNNGVTNSINVSRNLENPPHHDVGDLGNGSSVWYEEYPGTAKQWNFVCPNIIVKCPLTGATKNGLIVRLCHGAMIDWDGLYTRHCTSMCDKDSGQNNLWGVHLTNNHPSLKEFQMKLEKETMELEVARDEEKKRSFQHAEQEQRMKDEELQRQQQRYADDDLQRHSHQDDTSQECDEYQWTTRHRFYQPNDHVNSSRKTRDNRWNNNERRETSRDQRSSRFSSPNTRPDYPPRNHSSY